MPQSNRLSERAWEFAPLLSAQAADNEARGALNDTTLDALREGGFLGMWVPRCLGGAEAWPTEALEVIEALCYGDASAGWVQMAAQVAMGSAAAYLPPETAQQIFGKRHPIIAGQGAPNGRADVVPGGFRLTGRWRYGSGLLHAEYIHTGGMVFENGVQRMLPGTNRPDVRIFILPVSEAELLGNWDVLGLKATCSVDYTITDVFVPEEFTHLQAANEARTGGDLYRLTITGIGGICHTGFALGTGRRMMDELAAVARGEDGRPTVLTQRGGSESFHDQYGIAEAKLRAARAFAYEIWHDVEATLQRGDPPSTRQTTLCRLALNHATTSIAEVCNFAYYWGGGVALRYGTLQRCFRDMHSGTQHVTTSPNILRECARELLGLYEGKVWSNRGLVDPV